MPQRIRLALLVLALVTIAPAIGARPALAAEVPTETSIRVPKALIDWLKKNATALYLVFDEIMDDLTGCDCEPDPTTPAPPPDPEPAY